MGTTTITYEYNADGKLIRQTITEQDAAPPTAPTPGSPTAPRLTTNEALNRYTRHLADTPPTGYWFYTETLQTPPKRRPHRHTTQDV